MATAAFMGTGARLVFPFAGLSMGEAMAAINQGGPNGKAVWRLAPTGAQIRRRSPGGLKENGRTSLEQRILLALYRAAGQTVFLVLCWLAVVAGVVLLGFGRWEIGLLVLLVALPLLVLAYVLRSSRGSDALDRQLEGMSLGMAANMIDVLEPRTTLPPSIRRSSPSARTTSPRRWVCPHESPIW